MPWAYVENGKVKETFDGTRGAKINGVRHSIQIFGKSWTDKERADIGLLPLVRQKVEPGPFRKPTGNDSFRMEGGKVYATAELRDVSLDDAKGSLAKLISRYADNLKEGYFSREDRITAALNLQMLDGEERDRLKADVAPKMRFINAVDREAKKRLDLIETFESIDRASAYDWKDGWPLPEG